MLSEIPNARECEQNWRVASQYLRNAEDQLGFLESRGLLNRERLGEAGRDAGPWLLKDIKQSIAAIAKRTAFIETP